MPASPVVFVSHGSPMLPLEPGSAAGMLRELGRELLGHGPRAVVVLSPHWMTRGVALGAHERPPTLHDFHGFDPALRDLRYEVPGSPEVAAEARRLLQAAGMTASLDALRGLDHGMWVPLQLMFARAELPVVALSMPWPLDPMGAWHLGQALRPLREQDVLLLGSGSLTHNLHEFRACAAVDATAEPYVREFAEWVAAAIRAGDVKQLLAWDTRAPHALRAHPTPEHLLPLHFALGAAGSGARARRWHGGVHYGMLAMDAWSFD